MKKSRLLSALLLLALLAGLLTTGASAEEAAEPTDGGSGSAILDAMDVDATAAILVDPDSGRSSTRRTPMKSAIPPPSPR